MDHRYRPQSASRALFVTVTDTGANGLYFFGGHIEFGTIQPYIIGFSVITFPTELMPGESLTESFAVGILKAFPAESYTVSPLITLRVTSKAALQNFMRRRIQLATAVSDICNRDGTGQAIRKTEADQSLCVLSLRQIVVNDRLVCLPSYFRGELRQGLRLISAKFVHFALMTSARQHRYGGRGDKKDASFIRVFQAAVRRAGNGCIVFHALHSCAISLTKCLREAWGVPVDAFLCAHARSGNETKPS